MNSIKMMALALEALAVRFVPSTLMSWLKIPCTESYLSMYAR